MKRRSFFNLLVIGGGLVTATLAGIPALITALSPVLQRREKELWVPLGALDDFPVGDMSKAVVEVPRDDWDESLREKGVFVWRPTGDGEEVVVFSRNCTDLSCPVTWDPGSGWFFCPCHGGIFAEDGSNKAGPPDRPLLRYSYRVQEGLLEIDLRSLPPVT